jgi:hypothetical protein
VVEGYEYCAGNVCREGFELDESWQVVAVPQGIIRRSWHS